MYDGDWDDSAGLKFVDSHYSYACVIHFDGATLHCSRDLEKPASRRSSAILRYTRLFLWHPSNCSWMTSSLHKLISLKVSSLVQFIIVVIILISSLRAVARVIIIILKRRPNNNCTVPCQLGCIEWASSVRFGSIIWAFTFHSLSSRAEPNRANVLVWTGCNSLLQTHSIHQWPFIISLQNWEWVKNVVKIKRN